MKLGNNTPIPHPINLQHEAQSRTPHHHLECEIEVVKLDPPRRRQPREQTLRHRPQVRRQRAHVNKVARVGPRRGCLVASYQIVGDDEGLPGPEVSRVVEGDGG